jgi:hypothetical protein
VLAACSPFGAPARRHGAGPGRRGGNHGRARLAARRAPAHRAAGIAAHHHRAPRRALARTGHDHVVASRSLQGVVAPGRDEAAFQFRLDEMSVDEDGLRQAAA